MSDCWLGSRRSGKASREDLLVPMKVATHLVAVEMALEGGPRADVNLVAVRAETHPAANAKNPRSTLYGSG